MTKEKTRQQINQTVRVMSSGDAKHWYQPRSLDSLAAQPNGLWLRGRLQSRVGDLPGRGPVDVIGRGTDEAQGAITRRLIPVLEFMSASGWLIRSWTVAHSWMSQSAQHADLVELTPALFGYCHERMAHQLHTFADTRGYGITDRPAAASDASRLGPAPHLYVGGALRASGLQIGTQRTTAGIGVEWAGCNPRAIYDLGEARQVTVWEGERGTGNRLWADLAGHFGAHFTEVTP